MSFNMYSGSLKGANRALKGLPYSKWSAILACFVVETSAVCDQRIPRCLLRRIMRIPRGISQYICVVSLTCPFLHAW